MAMDTVPTCTATTPRAADRTPPLSTCTPSTAENGDGEFGADAKAGNRFYGGFGTHPVMIKPKIGKYEDTDETI